MENPNETWNDFSATIIQRDVGYQVSSSSLNDEEQTKVQLASLGQEMKNRCSELHEHQVNALENTRQPDPNKKSRQNASRFCNYCLTNGHTPSWCRQKIRYEEIKRVQKEMMAKKRVKFTNDYTKRRGPSHGSGQFNYNSTGNKSRWKGHNRHTTVEGATQFYPRNNWGNLARNNSFNSGCGRPFDRYQNHPANSNDDNYHRNGSTETPSRGSWQNIGTNPRSSSGPRRDPQSSQQYRPLWSSTPDNPIFRQSNSQ